MSKVLLFRSKPQPQAPPAPIRIRGGASTSWQGLLPAYMVLINVPCYGRASYSFATVIGLDAQT